MNIVDGNHLISWLADAPLFAVLVDTRDYKHFPEHRWLSDIAGAKGFHEPLVNKRVHDRTFFANDVRFLAVGFPAAGVAVYVKGPTFRQSPVLVYASSLVGLPSKGNGGDVIVPFSVGVLKV
jgi:hypothetical protein